MQDAALRIPTGQFRRKYPRRNFRREVGVLLLGNYVVSTAIEIGEGGLSLTSKTAVAVDLDLVLSFQIPSGGFVSVRGEIKTCRQNPEKTGYILGFAFRNLVFERKREIRSYVSAQGF